MGLDMEGGEEVCLEAKVERLACQGLSAEEIAREMGVDPGWVESLLSIWSSAGSDREDSGPGDYS